ncbi:MAG: hypothetical protein ACYC21_15505 [Eubacteriales bacterium]
MKRLLFVLRAMVTVSRDMFIGFIIGICATVLLYRVNANTHKVIALLIPAGVVAGIFKGLAKFVFLNVFSVLPSKGYRFNYPKYKLLLLWSAFLFGSLIYGYGINIYAWFAGPLSLLQENIILGVISPTVWGVLFGLLFVVGILAHLYEPPYNEGEFLPAPAPEEEIIEKESVLKEN